MSARLFTAVGAAALLAGSVLWWLQRPQAPAASPPDIAPVALYAATFVDPAGRPQALGRFQGQVLVINFWATWCAPCREEMPAFSRLHDRWKDKGVSFVGLSAEPAETVAAFSRTLAVSYPLWTGGDAVGELSARLGNRLGVLPHTALVDRAGRVVETKVGPYTEAELDGKLRNLAAKGG